MSAIKIIPILLNSFSLYLASAEQCDRYDPTSCPTSNGFQLNCVCIPFGGGCWCECPTLAEKINGECFAKPTKIGDDCIFFSSCSNIQGASSCPYLSEHPKCECNQNLYPSNDFTSCIASPKALDDPCSDAAPCDAIERSSCQISQRLSGNENEGIYQCKCLPSMYPNFDNTSCHAAPANVGDFCSPQNPCSNIPSSVCVQNGESVEPTCECMEEYSSSTDDKRCLPTRIGVKCSEESSCENLKGSSCFGSADEAICLCLWSIPDHSLTKCFGH